MRQRLQHHTCGELLQLERIVLHLFLQLGQGDAAALVGQQIIVRLVGVLQLQTVKVGRAGRGGPGIAADQLVPVFQRGGGHGAEVPVKKAPKEGEDYQTGPDIRHCHRSTLPSIDFEKWVHCNCMREQGRSF